MMRKMSTTLRYVVCCFLLIIVPIVSSAAELEVVTENWRPYNYLEEGEVKGVSTEIVKKVLDRAGLSYSITVYPWSRAYELAQTEENCMIYTIIRIAPREELFKWVRPLGKGGTTSLYRLKKNEQINPQTIEDAKNSTVVANLNSMDHVWLEHQGFAKLETPATVESAIRMFFNERVDMIAFDDAVIQDEFKNFGFDYAEVVQVMPLFETPPYMALSLSTSDEILEKMQKAYDELLEEQKINLVN